ncbi:hypothetical protein K474DRAFT_793848 [Panus rudis PR-1116 ss-1]|nr:hypothetical protein K474DRAFT_793848 [Panus rudis PR-1116 ss-1]
MVRFIFLQFPPMQVDARPFPTSHPSPRRRHPHARGAQAPNYRRPRPNPYAVVPTRMGTGTLMRRDQVRVIRRANIFACGFVLSLRSGLCWSLGVCGIIVAALSFSSRSPTW